MGNILYNIDNIHLFLWLVLMYIVSYAVSPYREEELGETKAWRATPFFAVLVLLPVFLMAVYGRPRSDTYLYIAEYRSLPASIDEGWNRVTAAKEPGFAFFQLLIKQLSGGSVTVYRMAIALIHTIPLIVILRRYSDDYLFSIFVFIAGGYHLAWMMNGLRQFMAVTIIFAATPWILNKKYIKSVLAVLLAAAFHRSALFMLPVIFIVQGKAWNGRTILFSVIAIAATFLFARDGTLFDEFADSVGYSTEAIREWNDDGAHPLRVLMAAIPMMLAYYGRDRLAEERSGIINLCMNMSVITTGVTLVAVVTSGILVGRVPIYTDLYNLILLPYVISEQFEGNTGTLIKYAAIIFYLLYFYVTKGF